MLQAWLPWLRGIDRPNWSLSVEAFLYLTFPFFASKLWRMSGRASMAAAIALYASGLGLLWMTGNAPTPFHLSVDARMFLPVFHLSTFLIGIALARWQHQHKEELDRWSNARAWFLLAAGAVVAWVLIQFSKSILTPQVYRNSGLFVPAFALVLVSLSLEGRLPARFFGGRWLESLGHASYALYLFQVPALHLLQRAHRQPSWPIFLFYLVLCIGISLLSFRFVELPLRAAVLRKAGAGKPAR